MTTQTRIADHGKTCLFYRLTAIILVMSLAALSACSSSSSDTRNTAKEATSGTYEILATILSPLDGSTILFKADGTTDANFVATHTGGTEPVEYTWTVTGQGYESTVSGSEPDTISFFNLGPHIITVTVKDINKITGSHTIHVTLTAPGLFALITQPGTDVILKAGGTVDFNAEASGGSSPYTFTWAFPGGTPNASTSQTATVTYAAPGVFTAEVTVQDSSGNIARDTVLITVQ